MSEWGLTVERRERVGMRVGGGQQRAGAEEAVAQQTAARKGKGVPLQQFQLFKLQHSVRSMESGGGRASQVRWMKSPQ